MVSHAEKTALLVTLIEKHNKKAPVDGYAPKNHVGVKPLCVFTAQEKVCAAHDKGRCLNYVHARTEDMTDAYVAWAKKRPMYSNVTNKV